MTEKQIIDTIQSMCEKSLSLDTFEKWEEVKYWLESARKNLSVIPVFKIPIIGTDCNIMSDNPVYKNVFEKFGKYNTIEAVNGCSPDLQQLALNQSVVFGDGENFHFRLTKIMRGTQDDAE